MKNEKQTRREQLACILKKSILDHTYPLGSRINLDELRRNLNVSNTPLREAISIIEGEGLVKYKTNAGVFVVNPTRKECQALAEFMLLLMESSYDYCTEYADLDTALLKMEKILTEQKECVERGDMYHYALCSNDFDRCIIDCTGNPYLIQSFDRNYSLLTLMNAEYACEEKESMELFCRQHEQILEAMRAGNKEKVHLLLKLHYYKEHWMSEADRKKVLVWRKRLKVLEEEKMREIG